MMLGATTSMRRTPTLNPSRQGGGRRRLRPFGSFGSLPIAGREAEQGLAFAKSVAKQGGGVAVSMQAGAGEVRP